MHSQCSHSILATLGIIDVVHKFHLHIRLDFLPTCFLENSKPFYTIDSTEYREILQDLPSYKEGMTKFQLIRVEIPINYLS